MIVGNPYFWVEYSRDQEIVHVREFVNFFFPFFNELSNTFLVVVSCNDTYILSVVNKLIIADY